MTRLVRLGSWIQIGLLLTTSLGAQTPHANQIRQQVAKIGVLGNLTVSTPGGMEYYGNLRSIGSDDFTINEVDLGHPVTLRYEEVSKVRSGYGTSRNIYGKRIHPHTKLIVGLLVVGGLLALVFVAVASDRS
ncbi:MAG TPA: hypothetical protein VGF16_11810 [Bryobacteraceae bacterium]|jgi:hypothetical protein